MTAHMWAVGLVGVVAGLLVQCAVLVVRADRLLAGVCLTLAVIVLGGAGVSPLGLSVVPVLVGIAFGMIVVQVAWLLHGRGERGDDGPPPDPPPPPSPPGGATAVLRTTDGGVAAAASLREWLTQELGHAMSFSDLTPSGRGAAMDVTFLPIFGRGGAGALLGSYLVRWMDGHSRISRIEIAANGRTAVLSAHPSKETLGQYARIWTV